jgi:chromosome segregation ATPase
MATKDEEREALKKIRRIVSGLGEESYIGFAFDGCFEIAEDNIENDFATSFKGKYENERKAKAEMTALYENEEARCKILNDDLQKTANKVKNLEQQLEMANKNAHTALKWNTDAQKQIEERDEKIAQYEHEILILKARLYDYMAH